MKGEKVVGCPRCGRTLQRKFLDLPRWRCQGWDATLAWLAYHNTGKRCWTVWILRESHGTDRVSLSQPGPERNPPEWRKDRFWTRADGLDAIRVV